MVAGQSIWFMLLAYVCSFMGALQVPAFIIAITYSAIGFIYNWKYEEEALEHSSFEMKNQSMFERCAHFWDSPIIKSTPNRQKTNADEVQPSSVQPISSPTTILSSDEANPTAVLKTKLELNLKTAKTSSTESENQSSKSQSAIYFKALFLACLVTFLYKQLVVLALSCIPVLVYVAKNIFVTFGMKELLRKSITDLYSSVQVSIKFHLNTSKEFCMSKIVGLYNCNEFKPKFLG